MPPLNSQYSKFVTKTANYTIAVSDDYVIFTTAAPGVVATLPLAKDCSRYSGQNEKEIINASGSSDPLEVAAQAGNTLVGATDVGATTLAVGQTGFVVGNQATVWTITGGSGASGVSGISGTSGISGVSGFTGASGFSGTSGVSGVSGFSGASGFSGVSGFSGTEGFSGASGTSGASGQSGFSGFSGAAP